MIIMSSTLMRLFPLLVVPWVALATNAASNINYCPLLGPVFPPPTQLPSDSAFIAARRDISTTLENAIQPGGKLGPDNSISVEIFAANNANPLLDFFYTSDKINTTLGVSKVDENTVFRIGSCTKAWTLLLFLIQNGITTFQDPIAKYIPEIQAYVEELSHNSTMETDKIDYLQWNEVTIGEMASQLAGIPRDFGFVDLTEQGLPFMEQLGFPALPESDIPPCGIPNPCNRTQFFNGLLKRHPTVPISSTPIYSNAAFQILAYAMEEVAGQTYEHILTERALEPLGLNQTFYNTPSMKWGVIPYADYQGEFWWNFQLGDENPAGSIYSSAKDMAAFGRAILNSTLISPAVTRRWMKPATHTTSFDYGVGAPWEILSFNYSRVIDLYTKSGDLGAYSATLVLSPDHGVGFTILAAGDPTTTITHTAVAIASDLISNVLIPALEQSAKEESKRFTGTYTMEHETEGTNSTNSSITFITDEGPGLKVTKWINNSTNMLNSMMILAGLDDLDLLDVRLYPTGLVSADQISFRAVIQQLVNSIDSPLTNPIQIGIFTASCVSWFTVDGLVYGSVGVDEFVFEVNEEGKVVGVCPRALRVCLSKLSGDGYGGDS